MPLPVRVYLCVLCQKIRPIEDAVDVSLNGHPLLVCRACANEQATSPTVYNLCLEAIDESS